MALRRLEDSVLKCRVFWRQMSGFLSGNLPIRHQLALWIQWFRCDLSGLSGFLAEQRAPEKSEPKFRDFEWEQVSDD
jgi:hypothetical protein